MERLTERFSNGQAAVRGCGDNCKHDFRYCKDQYGDCPTMIELYEKLAEYEDAEEQGMLKHLPCKVGDIVYEIAGYCWDCGEQTDYCHLNCKKPKYRIRKWNVESFEIGCTLRLHGRCGKSGIFNKTVFLTEEEAAAELERVDKK